MVEEGGPGGGRGLKFNFGILHFSEYIDCEKQLGVQYLISFTFFNN